MKHFYETMIDCLNFFCKFIIIEFPALYFLHSYLRNFSHLITQDHLKSIMLSIQPLKELAFRTFIVKIIFSPYFSQKNTRTPENLSVSECLMHIFVLSCFVLFRFYSTPKYSNKIFSASGFHNP